MVLNMFGSKHSILVVFLWIFSGGLFAQQYDFQSFGSGNGLPVDGVYDIEEDHLGRLLIGTEGGGLVRWDGNRFEIWDQRSHGLEDIVRCIYPQSKDSIWIGTVSSGLWLLQGDSILDVGIEALRGKEIRKVISMEDQLFIATKESGLYCLKDGEVELLAEGITLRDLIIDSENQLWMASDDGIFQWKQEQLFAPSDSLSQQQCITLFEDDYGRLWAGLQRGAIYRDDLGWHSVDIPELSDQRIKSIASDIHGDLWFGTRHGLIEVVEDGGQIQRYSYSTENGLTNDRIRDLHLSSYGTLWIGTYFGGIEQLMSQSIARYDDVPGFPDDAILSMLAVNQELLIATSDGKLILHDSFGTVTEIATLDNPIVDLTLAANENAVIATNELGERLLLTLSDRNLLPLGRSQSEAISAHISGGKLIEVGKRTIRFINRQLNTWDVACDEFTSFSANDTSCFIGTTCGLFTFPLIDGKLILPENVEEILPISGSENVSVRCMKEDSSGQLWVGSAAQGLYSYRDGKWIHQSNRYLSDLRIRSITFDSYENLWLVTAAGIDYLELAPGQEIILDYEHYGAKDGFEAQVLNLACTGEGIWVGTTRGIIHFDPEQAFTNPTPPGLILDQLRIDYEPLLDEAQNVIFLPLEPSLAHDQNHVTFYFRGVDLASEEPLSFQCKLEGLEEQWVDLGSIGSHTYPELPPGDFTFLVRAQNKDGKWNESPLTYTFSIQSPWYLEPWFILLVLAVLIATTYSFVQFRLRQLKKANEKLEAQVQERTAEVREEKEKSERLLLNILPKETAEELKEKGRAETRIYKNASVLFSDLKGFTQLTEKVDAPELVGLLDEAFKAFDRCCDRFDVEKIKTIGDAYMCATGIPKEDPEHAIKMVHFAQAMLVEMDAINARNIEKGLPSCEIRIGIHSGPLIAGVVGEKKFAYDIWGDTVNIAARMESSGEPSRINLSDSTFILVKNEVHCVPRGKVVAKNKGELEMYFVENNGE